jgi:predicted transcriptional regulator
LHGKIKERRRKMTTGEKMNKIRKMAGMTQEELAGKMNVSRQTISHGACTYLSDLTGLRSETDGRSIR